MLAKMTSKNQITLPKAVISKLPPSEYYEVEAVNDCIMLTPVRVQNGDAVRRKLELLGITEQDVADVVKQARSTRACSARLIRLHVLCWTAMCYFQRWFLRAERWDVFDHFGPAALLFPVRPKKRPKS